MIISFIADPEYKSNNLHLPHKGIVKVITAQFLPENIIKPLYEKILYITFYQDYLIVNLPEFRIKTHSCKKIQQQ